MTLADERQARIEARSIWRVGNGQRALEDDVVTVEEPLEIRVAGESVAVIMRTPCNDFELAAGDQFILCSDGLTQYLRQDSELADILSEHRIAGAAQGLIDLANRRGGSDNITALVVGFNLTDKPVEKASPVDIAQRVKALKKMPLFDIL